MSKLRAILLRSRIQAANAQMEQLRAAAADFDTRRTDLETAIHEAEARTDLSDEERTALDTQVEAFDNEVSENTTQIETLQNSVSEMERELQEIEEANTPQPAQADPEAAPEAAATVTNANTGEERSNFMPNALFRSMSFEQRSAFVQRESVKSFLQEVRRIAGIAVSTHRDVSGGSVTIPEEMLPLVKAEAENYSKLKKHVRVVTLNGDGRQPIMGDIPEAIWTEACGNINELNLTFTEKEIDNYKCAGFIPVCNSLLEDNDVNLLGELIDALGQSIGYSLDKAIAFGSGTKMPSGAFLSTNVPAANKITLQDNGAALTGKALFQGIIRGLGNAKHASGDLFWIMNEKTRLNLVAEALDFNANGALVSSVDHTMPVVGGTIETLDFVADDEFYAGYGKRYLLGERKGIQIKSSEEFKFVQDQTVFKGTMRADGKPVYVDAFLAFSTGGAPSCAVDGSHPFPSDDANDVQYVILDKSTASVKATKTIQLNALLLPENTTGTITWDSSDKTKATVSSAGVVTGVAAGTTVITATCNGHIAACTVTVTN